MIDGGNGGDLLLGNLSNDILNGGEGDDSLFGGADNDDITGGDGADIIDTGAGIDNVNYTELGQGIDTITVFNSGVDQFNFTKAKFVDDIDNDVVVGRNQNATDLDTDGIIFINDETVIDLTDLDQVATAIGDVASEVANSMAVFVVGNNDNTNTGIYEFASVDQNGTVAADELTAIAIVNAAVDNGDFNLI